MENIEKENSLETAKNRLNISGLTYLPNTLYVNDRIYNDDSLKNVIPLVKNANGDMVLRYKNLMNQYYWLVNEFIPSCEFSKLCNRKGDRTWITYTNYNKLAGECIVDYIDSNGSIMSQLKVSKGTKISYIPTPTKEGYLFDGWYTDKKHTIKFDFNTVIDDDLKLYAKYNRIVCNVTFVYYNNIEQEWDTKVVTVKYGESVPESKLPDTTWDNHKFIGWDNTYTNVKTDKTVTAIYNIVGCTVIYYDYVDPNDTTKYKQFYSETVQQGSTIKLLDKESSPKNHINYTFDKWKLLTSSGLVDIDDTYVVNTNIELFPTYIPSDLTVTFYDYGYLNPSAVTVSYHSSVVDKKPSDPTREGCTFIGWSMTDDELSDITDNINVVARYNCDINYIVDDEIYKTYTIECGDYVTYENKPSKESYTFYGWFDSNEYTTEFDFNKKIDNPCDIYGYYLNHFNIVFKWFDGREEKSSVTDINYGNNATPPFTIDNAPTKEDDYGTYSFYEWDSNAYLNVKDNALINAVYSSEKMLTVTFKDGDTILSTVLVKSGSSVPEEKIPTPPIHEGYEFDKWGGLTDEILIDTIATAVYKINTFDITYYDYVGYLHTGDIVYEYNADYNSTCITPYVELPDIEFRTLDDISILKKGTFNGTYKLYDIYSGITYDIGPSDVVVKSNCNFVAQYTITSSSVTYCNILFKHPSTEEIVREKQEKFGTEIKVSDFEDIREEIEETYVIPEGYIFVGWENNVGIVYDDDNDITLVTDMTLTPKYMNPNVSVNYKVNINDDILIDGIEYNYGDLIDKPSSYTYNEYEGYHVPDYDKGVWYKEKDCVLKWDFETDKIKGNMSLYANYIKNTYEYNFIIPDDDGELTKVYETIFIEYGEENVAPSYDPIISGYEFKGWYMDEECTIPYNTENTAKENLTIYGKFE